MAEQQKHKPGPLKQKNKPHKFGRHRTKGIIDNENRGKVSLKSAAKKNKLLDKQQKRHQARQIRKNKWEEAIAEKRKLSSDVSPPHVVALYLLSKSCDIEEVLNLIKSSDDSIEFIHKSSYVVVLSKKHKQRFIILLPDHTDLFGLLDAAKVADTFLFVSSASGDLDGLSEWFLSCLISQGLPSAVHVIQGLKNVPVKKQSDVKKSLAKKLEKWFPDVKLHSLDSYQDGGIILRQIYNQKIKKIHYRENRPYMLVEETKYVAHDENETSKGTLQLCGYLKGRPLSVNSLLYLPGLGDCQMKQIDRLQDPYPIQKRRQTGPTSMEVSSESNCTVIDVEDSDLQESLQAEADVDPMEGEQTWPTEEELIEADRAARESKDERKIKKVVPKGTSDYQASWILDEYGDVEEDEDDDDDEDDDAMSDTYQPQSDQDDLEEEDEELETISIAPSTVINDEKYDENMDMDEEQRELAKYRLEHENDMFPDEIDTPMDVPARDRFIKYRGLKSFRTSPWDSKENLPLDYARIFQFQHFGRTKKKVMASVVEKEEDINEKVAQPGHYIQIHVKDVPQQYATIIQTQQPLVVFGLLPFEQKMTVMNYVIKRHLCLDLPIKSKDKLIFHVGYRRFITNPIFSQHTTGNKFKMERFLKHDSAVVATTYAPIMFPPAPVLVFTEDHRLVATGTVLNSNPDRVIVKKIVLSGHPFKINKKSSVVRYMFFSRDDILWFKPVEVYTKYGRRGHIKESLGTHGHMKCVFDGQLKAQDTVCMNLYKRQFPKWTYEVAPNSHNAIINEITPNKNDDVQEDVEM